MADIFDLFGFEETAEDKKYTTKVGVPQYLPSNECPKLFECFDDRKYKELLREINMAQGISQEEKQFLEMAATRHIVFNYSKVADYYAHASKEMQELMEKSALVIIDINDAIVNGYVKLNKTIESMLNK